MWAWWRTEQTGLSSESIKSGSRMPVVVNALLVGTLALLLVSTVALYVFGNVGALSAGL